MRYELGVLQLLVASAGRRRPARIDVVARTLGKSPIDLDGAVRYLRTRGFVDAHCQPTDMGRARARFLKMRSASPSLMPQCKEAPLPSRIPPPSGVFSLDEIERSIVETSEQKAKAG